MSEIDRNSAQQSDEQPQTGGINLVLVYSLIAVALISAIGFAILIVLPFYHRR